MEERKLTDEEIIEALKKQPAHDTVLYLEKGINATDILNLIYRLQAKNSMIENAENHWHNMWRGATEEIEQLKDKKDELKELLCIERICKTKFQKQVDELTDKLGNVLLGVKADEFLIARGVEKSVKDTAYKILGDLRNIFIEQSSYGCDANQHIGYYDYEMKIGLVIEQIEEYAKEKYGIEYGVEVE